MKLAGTFLAKFQKLTPPDDSIKNELAVAVQRVVGAAINKKDIRISHGVAFVHGSSVMKNTIAINRGKILAMLYDALPKAKATVRDIR